jgi:hypothetical protein
MHFLKNLINSAISTTLGSIYPIVALVGLLITTNAGHFIYEHILKKDIEICETRLQLITNDAKKIDKTTLKINSYLLKDNDKNDKLAKKENELIKKDLEIQSKTLEKLYKDYEIVFNLNVSCEKKVEEFLRIINEIKKEVPDLVEIEK